MTDWENNRWVDPASVTGLISDNWIKVFTVWIWKKEWAIVPYTTMAWDKEFIKNPDWSNYLTYLDEDSLRKVAYNTWWQYFLAESEKIFNEIFELIHLLEKKEIKISKKLKKSEIFHALSLTAMILFSLEVILSLTVLRKRV